MNSLRPDRTGVRWSKSLMYHTCGRSAWVCREFDADGCRITFIDEHNGRAVDHCPDCGVYLSVGDFNVTGFAGPKDAAGSIPERAANRLRAHPRRRQRERER